MMPILDKDLLNTLTSGQCYYCKNRDRNKITNSCIAFPNGIPENILSGEFDHTKKHPSQSNDILFESVEIG